MNPNIQLVHLTFIGPRVEPATIDFGPGLNLIYGPSNTGKSSIFDAIDFMLGRSRKLKEIPEHDPYEYILLGLSISGGESFTLVRNITGTDLKVIDGIHYSLEVDAKITPLKLSQPTKKIDSLPNYLLGRIELAGKALRKNSKNEAERLTLRSFRPLFIVNETEIQKESSPYVSTQFTKQTAERSMLRLILTGVDDSSLVPEEKEKQSLSREARLSLLSELIEEQEEAIAEVADSDPVRKEIETQQSRLQELLNSENESLRATEAVYRETISGRNQLRLQLDRSETRLAEIQEMVARFELLSEQYLIDLARLENLVEAGTLFVAFPSGTCPLCGAAPDQQHETSACDGDAESVVSAANHEIDKINVLRADLGDLLNSLKEEENGLRAALPNTTTELQKFERQIETISPQVSEQRLRYSEAVAAKSSVDRTLSLLDDLARLERKREDI